MGYKLAGCDVIGANDIDPEMAWHYKVNLNPRLYYLCPIRDLLTAALPSEMFQLDILDGSPPCSTFSMSGGREDDWGKEKHFREGQAKQVLSDLFFDFLDLVARLKPKAVIAENVKGMLIGNAKGYTKLVVQRFHELGYKVQVFLLNAADCGVPQRRERVFFCAVRDDVSSKALEVSLKSPHVNIGNACADIQNLSNEEREANRPSPKPARLWSMTKPGCSLRDANMRDAGFDGWFTWHRLNHRQLCPTIVAADTCLHWNTPRHLTFREIKRLGSFPDDYQAKSEKIGKYMVGMSVPPFMARDVAKAVCSQWLGVKYGPA